MLHNDSHVSGWSNYWELMNVNKAELERTLKKTVGAALKRVVIVIDGDFYDIMSVEREGELVLIYPENAPRVTSNVAS